jgi:hypothetical protein
MEIDEMAERGNCEQPRWCDHDHAESWPVHSRSIGEVPVAGGVIDVVLTQYGDQPPVVTLYRHDTDETVVEVLRPDLADRLASLLAQAVAELGGVR